MTRFSRLALMLTAVAVVGCSGTVPGPGAGPGESAGPGDAAWWPGPHRDRWYPVSAVVLPTGDLVLADSQQNRLFRISSDGVETDRLPSPGGGVVEWTALSPAPGLSFYALDGPGLRVHQFDLSGNYLGVALDLDRVRRDHDLGSIEPGGLAVARSGQALVTDELNDRILAFGPGWTYLGTWGRSGSSVGAWRRPAGVALDDEGNALVSDVGNERVVLLDPFGGVLSFWDLDESPRGVAPLEGGRWVVVLSGGVEILGPGLIPERRIPLPAGPGCTGRAHASGAVTADRGRLFVGEGCSGYLHRVPYPGR